MHALEAAAAVHAAPHQANASGWIILAALAAAVYWITRKLRG
jgi:hypothetical protein